MSHGSITLEIMNLYGCLLMEKFRIGNVPQFGPKSDVRYRVESDRVRCCDRAQKWVQIQRGLFCEQSAYTIV
jgi:hypothetical protein